MLNRLVVVTSKLEKNLNPVLKNTCMLDRLVADAQKRIERKIQKKIMPSLK